MLFSEYEYFLDGAHGRRVPVPITLGDEEVILQKRIYGHDDDDVGIRLSLFL